MVVKVDKKSRIFMILRLLTLIVLIFMSSLVYSQESELKNLLNEGEYTAKEKNEIILIFNDAAEMELYTDDLLILLKELRLKNISNTNQITALVKMRKVLLEIKKSDFPYQEDKQLRKIAYYLKELYSILQFEELSKEFRIKAFSKKEIENFFELVLFMNSQGISYDDAYIVLRAIMIDNRFGNQEKDLIKRPYIRSKDLRMSNDDINRKIISGLSRKIPLRKIVLDLEKSAKEGVGGSK